MTSLVPETKNTTRCYKRRYSCVIVCVCVCGGGGGPLWKGSRIRSGSWNGIVAWMFIAAHWFSSTSNDFLQWNNWLLTSTEWVSTYSGSSIFVILVSWKIFTSEVWMIWGTFQIYLALFTSSLSYQSRNLWPITKSYSIM